MQALRSVTAARSSVLTCCLREVAWRRARVTCGVPQVRWRCAEALTVPAPEGEPKVYPEKIQNIVLDISKLTLLEVSELNQLLRKTLNIPDAPVMAFGAPMGAPAAAKEVEVEDDDEEEAAPTKVQTSFTLKMNKFDETRKVALIKEVKARLEGFNLVQAKKFVESCPCVVKADISKDEAEGLLEAFKAVGADCDIE